MVQVELIWLVTTFAAAITAVASAGVWLFAREDRKHAANQAHVESIVEATENRLHDNENATREMTSRIEALCTEIRDHTTAVKALAEKLSEMSSRQSLTEKAVLYAVSREGSCTGSDGCPLAESLLKPESISTQHT